MLFALLALQAAAAIAPAPPERIDLLVPVAAQPCTRRAGDEILVCADALPSQALPLPAEANSPRARAVNPDITGTGALAAEGTPCAALTGGCQVGIDVYGMATAAVRAVEKLVAPGSCCEEPGEATNPALLVRDAAGVVKGRAPAKGERVAIDLAEPSTAGRVHP